MQDSSENDRVPQVSACRWSLSGTSDEEKVQLIEAEHMAVSKTIRMVHEIEFKQELSLPVENLTVKLVTSKSENCLQLSLVAI